MQAALARPGHVSARPQVDSMELATHSGSRHCSKRRRLCRCSRDLRGLHVAGQRSGRGDQCVEVQSLRGRHCRAESGRWRNRRGPWAGHHRPVVQQPADRVQSVLTAMLAYEDMEMASSRWEHVCTRPDTSGLGHVSDLASTAWPAAMPTSNIFYHLTIAGVVFLGRTIEPRRHARAGGRHWRVCDGSGDTLRLLNAWKPLRLPDYDGLTLPEDVSRLALTMRCDKMQIVVGTRCTLSGNEM